MTAAPPPVPPEIVERLRLAISDPGHFTKRGERYTEPISSWQTRAVLAAVYGDIVEAARRAALDAAAEAIRALDNSDDPWIRQGARTAARIVTGLRDATAPRTAPAASDEEIR